ncbi:unnamed protein product, partial [Adineta steineri]
QISMDLCKFRVYGSTLSVALSRHFLCLILLDRWMITSRSASLRNKSSLKYGRWLILFSFVFWMLFSLHVPIGNPSVTLSSGCMPPPGSTYAIFYTVYTIIIGIFPLFIMILFVFLIMKNLRSRGRAIRPSASLTQQTLNHLPTRQSRSYTLLITYAAVTFALYILASSIFRQQFKECCKRIYQQFIRIIHHV